MTDAPTADARGGEAVLRVRNLIPKESLATDHIEGVDQIMADAVAAKFISAPLTSEQLKELVQIPK